MQNNIIQDILNDIAVEAVDEFQMNFRRKGFFDPNTWQETKKPNPRGSLMNRTGRLSGSLHAEVKGDSVVITSDVPYAAVHNDGGNVRKRGGKGTFKMPKRQFVGTHPHLEKTIEDIAKEHLEKYANKIFNNK